jgi:hypothetical protein
LRAIPKICTIRFIPDVDHEARRGSIGFHVLDPLGEEGIIVAPVTIVARIILGAVCTPKIVEEEYKGAVVLEGGLII